MLRKLKKVNLKRFYQIEDWTDDEDFLKKVAEKKGKLLKGGEPDITTTAKRVLMDWQRGQLPYYTLPPGYVDKMEGQEDDLNIKLHDEEVQEDEEE
jgi:nuclear GTP-binding protein